MTSCVVSLFFLVCLSSSNTATPPTGLKVRITENARDVLKHVGLVCLEKLLHKPFGDFQIPLRSASITVKGFTITKLLTDPAEVDFQFQQDIGVLFHVQDLMFEVELQRALNVPLFSDLRITKGSTTFSGEGVSATIVVRLKRNSEGRLNVEIPKEECKIKVENMTPKSTGTLGHLVDSLKSKYENLFNTELCPALPSWINEKLKNLPMVWTVLEGRRLHLDYSLSSDIVVTSRSLDVPFKGLVYVQGQAEETGLVWADREIIFTESDHMIYVGISEFFFNSAAMSLYKSGPFNVNVPQVEGVFVKSLEALGLHSGPLKLELTKAPTIKISKAGLSTSVNIKTQSQAKGEILVVDCQLDMRLDLQRIQLDLVLKQLKCDVKSEKITGHVSIAASDPFLHFMDKWFDGRVPLALPMGLGITEAKVQYEDGYVVVGGSLTFDPLYDSSPNAAAD